MSARSVRTLIRNSSALISIAYEYGRPFPFKFIQKRRVRRSVRDDQISSNRRVSQAVAPVTRLKKKKASLVIFDKDGTLICFHAMWVPWALNVATKISESIKMGIESELHELLGLCSKEMRVRSGLLAEGTMVQVRDAIARVLISRGISAKEAVEHVMAAIIDSNRLNSNTVKQITDVKMLFSQLKENDIKIAICTADSRQGTLTALKKLNLSKFVDMVVCGDDAGAMPKPHPHNALSICRTLDIDPLDTLVVGDTLADMGMGRSANLGGTVGVLSGVAGINELRPQADHIVRDVGELLPIVMDMRKWSLS